MGISCVWFYLKEQKSNIVQRAPEPTVDTIKLRPLVLSCKGSGFYDPIFAERSKGENCLPSEPWGQPGLGGT